MTDPDGLAEKTERKEREGIAGQVRLPVRRILEKRKNKKKYWQNRV